VGSNPIGSTNFPPDLDSHFQGPHSLLIIQFSTPMIEN